MEKTLNIKDIARICGVGVSTVSRVLNDNPDVKIETKNKVMAVIQQNNYIPNNSARNLKRNVSTSIGLIIKGITNPLFFQMIKEIEKSVSEKNYTTVIHQVNYDEDEISAAMELVKEKRLQAIVFLGGDFNHSPERLNTLNIPIVTTTITEIGGVDKSKFSSVTLDHFQEAYHAVDYICKNGHKKVAIVTSGTENAGIGALRWKGYQAAITDNGLTLDKNLTAVTNDSFEIKAAYEAVKELLDTAEFTCVFAISDIMAMGAICAISERGLRVPEDISVVGFDGIELGAYYNPPLTTISFPAQKMAEGISEMLMSTLEDKAPTEHRVFKAQLVERRSFCAR